MRPSWVTGGLVTSWLGSPTFLLLTRFLERKRRHVIMAAEVGMLLLLQPRECQRLPEEARKVLPEAPREADLSLTDFRLLAA